MEVFKGPGRKLKVLGENPMKIVSTMKGEAYGFGVEIKRLFLPIEVDMNVEMVDHCLA
jgi:hypothetical protein